MSFIDSILGRASAPTPVVTEAPQPVAQPANPTPAPIKQEPINPLDAYAKIFENANKEEGPPAFNVDGKVLDEVSGKMNFISQINPELLQKAQGGDASAIIELIQEVGRNAYKSALHHTTALTDAHLNRRGEFEKATLSKNVKDTLTNEALSSIPNSNHPVVRAELRRIAENLARQNPDAPASEIAKDTQKYFATVYNALSPQSPPTPVQKAGEIDDWEKFLSNGS